MCGGMLGRVNVINLLLVDDIKLFVMADQLSERLTSTVQLINKTIGM